MYLEWEMIGKLGKYSSPNQQKRVEDPVGLEKLGESSSEKFWKDWN